MNYLTPKFIVFKKKISKKARFKLLFKARNRICGLRKLIVLLASPSNLSQILSISSIFHTLRSKLSDWMTLFTEQQIQYWKKSLHKIIYKKFIQNVTLVHCSNPKIYIQYFALFYFVMFCCFCWLQKMFV